MMCLYWMLALWPALICLPFVHSIMDEVCEDLYGRYCEFITAEKCYLAYNRKLCCATCQLYNRLHAAETEDRVPCSYGDRVPNCSKMEKNICYDSFNRTQCCGTCARLKMDNPNCRYDDSNLAKCAQIKPHHCYKASVREECCGSCSRFHTGREGCEYGDRVHLFRKQRRMYNCQAYVAHFGYGRCRLPWEEVFSHACCGSCHKAYTMKSNRLGVYWRRSG